MVAGGGGGVVLLVCVWGGGALELKAAANRGMRACCYRKYVGRSFLGAKYPWARHGPPLSRAE